MSCVMNKMRLVIMSLIISTLLMASLGYSQDKVALLIANSELGDQNLPEAKQKAETFCLCVFSLFAFRPFPRAERKKKRKRKSFHF